MAFAVLGGFAACGGADRSAEDEVAGAIKRAFNDASMYCEELITRRFIERVYGNRHNCRAVIVPSDAPANHVATNHVAISRIKVDGYAATAHVRVADVLKGTVALRKEGDRWRLDAYGEDLLRLVVKELLLGFTKVKGLDKRLVGRCASRMSAELPDDRITRLAYAVFGERLSPADAKQLGGLLGLCIVVVGEPHGNAVMGRFFEEAMRNDNPPLSDEERACVIRRVDRSIAADLTSPRGEFRLTPGARRALAVAAAACGYDGSRRASP